MLFEVKIARDICYASFRVHLLLCPDDFQTWHGGWLGHWLETHPGYLHSVRVHT